MSRTPPSTSQPADTPKESRQARRTRAALLRAAREVFETKGYTRTRLEDITEEAGYAAGSFYTYFDSKEAIFSQVIRTLGTDLEQHGPSRAVPTRRPAVHDSDTLQRRIKTTNDRYFRSLATDGRLWAVVEEAALRDEPPRAILNERWRRFRVGVTTALKQWQSDSVVDSHRDLAAAVDALSAMTEWLVTLRRVYGFSFPTPVGSAEATWAWMRTLTTPSEAGSTATVITGLTAPPVEAAPTTTSAKQRTRWRLIDAGLKEFSANSVAKARVADITRTAGVAVGSFYRHFPSKSDLLAAVLTAMPSLLFHVPEIEAGPTATIDAINRRHVTTVCAIVGFWRTVAEAALTDPLVRAIVNEQRSEWMRQLADLIASWLRDGSIDRTVDPIRGAVCLAALTERSTHLWMILEDQRSADPAISELNDCWRAILRIQAR